MYESLTSLLMKVHLPLSWKRLMYGLYLTAVVWLMHISLVWLLGSHYIAFPATLALLFVADRVRANYISELTARVDTNDSFSWDVEINQVKIGEISDADYALIRRRVFSDEHVYVAQVLNLLRVALNSFEYCFRAIPLGFFWVGVGLAIFSPETISSLLVALQYATPGDIRHAVGAAGSMLAIMMIVSVIFNWVFGMSRFGFINRFDEAVGAALRKRLGVAAQGDILLTRWSGGPVCVDEMN